MEKSSENSQRIQTSILNPIEKKVLVYIAERLPKWVTSDMLTVVGVLGSMVVCLGYILSRFNVNLMWIASLGFVINWFGDSLDGSIARVRNAQRPLYGFYLDHNIDCVCEFFMFVGFGLSGLCNFWVALLCYVVYLQLEVYVAINAHLKNEFKLTYGKLGPTEFRVIIILINIFLMYFEPMHTYTRDCAWTIGPDYIRMTFHLMDFIGLGIFGILLFFYLTSFFSDLKYFDKIDPLKKN